MIRTEPDLRAIRNRAATTLALCEGKLEHRKAREAARARFSTFGESYDEAVFHQSQYTGLEPEADLRATRAAARRGLEQFHPRKDGGLGLALTPRDWAAGEVELITSRYYELSLILAEAIARPLAGEDPSRQAQQALLILDRDRRYSTPDLGVSPPPRQLSRAVRSEIGRRRPVRRRRRSRSTPVGAAAVDDFLAGEEAYRRRGELEGGIRAFRNVLARDPDRFWAQYLLAICHLKEHQPAEARAALTACQGRRPGFVWTYLLKGFAEGEMRDFDLAEIDFARAAELGLGPAERYVMLVNRGVMRVRSGRPAVAVNDFLGAIALRPDGLLSSVNLGQAYQVIGRLGDALAVLDRAIDRAPGQALLHRARASVHRLRPDDRAALEDRDRAIALSPGDDPNLAADHVERALILEKFGRNLEALAACDRALALEPNGASVHRVRGAVLMKLKRFDEAIRSFDVCLARGSPSSALYEARGLALAHRGSYGRAIADYTMAMSTGPATASLYGHRGWSYLFSGAPAPAEHDFDEALRLSPADAHALGGRALAYVQERKVPEAVADARACARPSNEDARQIFTAARVFCLAAGCLEARPVRTKGDWESAGRYRVEALTLIERAIFLLPEVERPAFWMQVIRTDRALEPIRASHKFRQIDTQFATSNPEVPAAGARPR